MRRVCFLFLFITSVYQLSAQSGIMIGDRIAMFYPQDFDSTRQLPSLALVDEPKPTGTLPKTWTIRPEFSISESGQNVAEIAYEGHVDFYGTGEVTGSLKRNGKTVKLWNTDNYGYRKDNGKRLYQSHPWVMGVREDGSAFGLIADNSWEQSITTGSSVLISSEGPSFRVIVIERDNPKELVMALADLTGKMELPPIWALGYQQSRYSYFPDSRVREIADEFRSRKIPCDVIWMDINYMEGFRVFTFDKKGFPDPEGLNSYLHGKGFKSVYMIDPGIKVDTGYFVYKEGTAGDHWVQNNAGQEYNGKVWPGQCAFPDFTRPQTQKWWSSLYKPFMAMGIDGVWNDMNEPAVFDGPDMTMPLDNLHRGGGVLPKDVHARYHNVYGLLMVRATRNGILAINPDLRPFILSRANYLGGQRYAATWTGDNSSNWEHLRMSVPMSLNLGLSGQPFNGSDIGGFTDDANPELLGQWMALGAYYPFARNHAAQGVAQQEPWVYGPDVEATSRVALSKRYRLLPFLYTLFRESSITGLPIMRPVFMADASDKGLRDEEQAFMWGDDLLIIPNWAEDPAIPDGDWETIELMPEETVKYQPALKLRDGAIIPVGPVIQNTTDYSIDSLTLFVNINKDHTAQGYLYHDDGNGFSYKEGDFALYEFKAEGNTEKVSLTIKQVEGDKKSASVYRIALIEENKTIYSDWQESAANMLFTLKEK